MEILVFVGSLRKDSYNRKVFEAYKTVVGHKAKLTEISYANFPLFDEDVENTNFPEEVTTMTEQIRKADAVLFVSPEYNYSIPGALKNALDWLSRPEPQPFDQKPTAVIGASQGRFGTTRMQHHLRQVGIGLNMQMMAKPEVMIGEVQKQFDDKGKLNDKIISALQKHFESFLEHIKQKARKS